VGFFLGLFLHISKCLNSTCLLNFISFILHELFLPKQKANQISFKPRLPQQMRSLLIVSLVLLNFLTAGAQKADQIKLKDLQQVINKPSDKIQVINFWATWCAPCVKEIPLFEKLNQVNKEVEVTLVSMDYDLDPNPEKVYRFMTRKNLQSKVVILAEQNPNSWINKIDKSWKSGTLPATLIINTKTGRRKFVQQELHEGDLEKMIEDVGK
jgi:thiol-disulfide isomerase/thioredoxin